MQDSPQLLRTNLDGREKNPKPLFPKDEKFAKIQVLSLAPDSMISPEERLIKAQRRHIRDLEEETDYLRSMLWNETQGTHECFQPEPVEERREELVGPGPQDTFLKTLLTE